MAKIVKGSLTLCLVAARNPGWVCWRPHLAGTRQYYLLLLSLLSDIFSVADIIQQELLEQSWPPV